MPPKELAAFTDQELLAEAKKRKSASLVNAVLIGCLLGIVLYSVMKNTWGLVTLIPSFFFYRLTKNSTNGEELNALLKERKLK